MSDKKWPSDGLIIGSMSAGSSNWFPPVFWLYHCYCGIHYQGIYDKFKYQNVQESLPIKKCPKCGKIIDQVNGLDYGSEAKDE